MRNVLKVLHRDIVRLVHAPAAFVVVLVLAILPSVYTWYNVVGFWDPYENTSNLKVCVVNEDRGGASELTGKLDVGERIVVELRKDHQLDWEFTSRDEAMDMLYAGRAYAVFVIPADFTAQLLTLTTGAFEKPDIEYYVNEKAGPVSPKITDAGATALDETVNAAFVSTVSDAVVQAVDAAVDESERSASRVRSAAAEKAGKAKQSLSDARAVLASVGADVDAARDGVPDALEVLEGAKVGISDASDALAGISSLSADMQDQLTDVIAQATPDVSSALLAISQASSKANGAIGAVSGDIQGAQGTVDASIQQARIVLQQSEQLARYLEDMAHGLPDTDPLQQQILSVVSLLDARNQELSQSLDGLESASASIAGSAASAADAARAFDDAVQQAADAAQASWDGVATDLLPQANALLGSVAATASSLSAAIMGASGVADEAALMLGQMDAALAAASDAATQTDQLLEGLEGRFDDLHADIMALDGSVSLASYFGLDDLDADAIADFMGSPTALVTEELYPLNAYGSAMAPLFMNLTFWIGAFMLLVIMRQEVDRTGIPGLTVSQSYLGRFLLLALIACLQAIICCVGVLALGVQAVSAPALFAAAVVASLSYLSLIYALSVTLQHIGKGICIILVFAQIPGATGLYPIEMTSGFFQAVYPAFPFTYGIGAMREAICGFYGSLYARDLIVLAAFFAVSMALGLLVRPHLANVNRMVARQIRAGGLYNAERVEVPARRYRISQILRALSDKQEYREAITRRYERYSALYPKLVRGIAIGGALIPVIISVVFALTPAEKVWLLTFWLLWIMLVVIALVVVEGVRYSIIRQMRLEDMPTEGLISLFGSRGVAPRDGEPSVTGSVEGREGDASSEMSGVPGALGAFDGAATGAEDERTGERRG